MILRAQRQADRTREEAHAPSVGRGRTALPDRVRHGAAWLRRCHACQVGQGMVEAAVALPLVLAVAVALVQFALFAHAQHVVVAAVQDGARTAAGDGRTLDEGFDHARAVLRAGLGGHADRVVLTVDETEAGDAVVVEAAGHLQTVIPWVTEASLPLYGRALVYKEQFRAGRAGR